MMKIIIVVFVMGLMPFFGCLKKTYHREAESLSMPMKLEQKIGQLIMVAVPGTGMHQGAESIIKEYLPGGVILFGYNLSSYHNNKRFINELQQSSLRHTGIPLFVSIDQEGGRVVRITEGVTQFPGNMSAGTGGDDDLVYQWGRVLGLELRLSGVNMNLAPVLDVNNNPYNPVINTRSFGSDPGLVARMGSDYIRGIQDSHCIAVGKHFPGHGDTDKDSHYTLPVIRSDLKRLRSVELVPFKKAIDAGVESIMTAHISFPEIPGSNEPATLSPLFLTGILRNELKFTGLIITDDLEMAAISKKQEMGEAAVKSVLAGADIVLISSYGRNIPVIVGALKKAVVDKRISEARLNESLSRILEVKMRYNIIAYENGRVHIEGFALTDKESLVLKEAPRVNSELSKRGILYFGDAGLLYPGGSAVRLFITPSAALRGVLKQNKNNIICGIHEVARLMAKKGGKTVLYYHVSKPDLKSIQIIAAYCKNKGVGFVIISSGNPFPITVSGLVQAGLLSFSDTDESIRLLGICLNGGFRPALNSRLFLGIKKQ